MLFKVLSAIVSIYIMYKVLFMILYGCLTKLNDEKSSLAIRYGSYISTFVVQVNDTSEIYLKAEQYLVDYNDFQLNYLNVNDNLLLLIVMNYFDTII